MPISQPMPTPVSNTDIVNRTRRFIVPAIAGYNASDSTVIVRTTHRGLAFIDNKICQAGADFLVPDDFQSGMSVKAVVRPGANGNAYLSRVVYYGACGEALDTHDDSIGWTAIAVATADENNCIGEIALSAEAIGDIVSLFYQRDATHVDDTVAGTVNFVGWLIEYTADM